MTTAPATSPSGPRIGQADASTARSVPVRGCITGGAPAEGGAAAGVQALPHGIRQRSAVMFIDETDQRAERLPGRLPARDAGHRLGAPVQVVDVPLCIRRYQ